MRCEGVTIKEVRGQNRNVRCEAKAAVVRRLAATIGKPKAFHYCRKCAAYWDRQQALIASIA